MELHVLHVHLNNGSTRLQQEVVTPIAGPISYALEQEDPEALVLGAGPLGDLQIPGANRLVIAGRSPVWGGFYVSTMGSAGASLRHLGIDLIALHGRSPRNCALVISRTSGRISIQLKPLPTEQIWRASQDLQDLQDPSDHRNAGCYALLSYVLQKNWTQESSPRVLVTGPAAQNTTLGALASAVPKKGEPLVLETWAGRGGFGSRLVQEHGVAAIIFDAPADAGRRSRKDKSKAIPVEEIMKGTSKYRYHPLLATGGTLGSNLTTLREKLLTFNSRSMYWAPEIRNDIHSKWIENHYLKQFNQESNHGRNGRDCGETCPAVCKKVQGGIKKDYQPYAALGPHIGVFDQNAASMAADWADTLGFDAVEAGALVAWAFDCLSDGILTPTDLELTGAPDWNVKTFHVEQSSQYNAKLACSLLSKITNPNNQSNPILVAMTQGIRAAAKSAGPQAAARASYSAMGSQGSLAPNHYWTPGIVGPIPLPGKYYTDYSLEFTSPQELGKRCADRLIRELAMDNLGMCRFQREWAEDRLPDLLQMGYPESKPEQLWQVHQELAQKISQQNIPVFWETQRSIHRVSTYLQEAFVDDPSNHEIGDWVKAFQKDEVGTAKDYWKKFSRGLTSALSDDL